MRATIARLKSAERYPAWSFFTETYLQGEGLWELITGEDPYPVTEPLTITTSAVSATSGTSTSPATPRQSTQPTASSPSVLTDAQRESIRKWKQRDAKTRATILALLDESLYGRFRWCTTAADLWNAIRTEFEDGTTQNVLLWWTDLTQRRLEEATPLQTHIDHLQDAYRKLQNANFAIPEQIFALVILSSLPEEWNQVATSLHTTLMAFSPEERVRNFNSAFVTRRLLEHEKLLSIRMLQPLKLLWPGRIGPINDAPTVDELITHSMNAPLMVVRNTNRRPTMLQQMLQRLSSTTIVTKNPAFDSWNSPHPTCTFPTAPLDIFGASHILLCH
jgi:hypothetical protein